MIFIESPSNPTYIMQVTSHDQEKLKLRFVQYLLDSYPGLALQPDMIAPHMLSPFQIQLPQSVLTRVQNFVKTIFQARTTDAWLNHYEPQTLQKKLVNPGNYAILMSYDFHLDEHQIPKLIEINTNASFLALGLEFYKMLGHSVCNPSVQLNTLVQNIQDEKRLFDQRYHKDYAPVHKICIIDEKPSEQKLYAEFLLYQEFFKKNGLHCKITDINDHQALLDSDFIYNRYTDFYLSDEKSQFLFELYFNGTKCFSPNPFEYFQLADKKRLEEWTDPQSDFFTSLPGWQEHVRPLLLKSIDLTPVTATHIWDMRKKLFFKPRNSFGAKQSYRGASISRGLFDNLVSANVVAQEFCPAPTIRKETASGTQEFKYDLRFYVYADVVQFCIARVYQGQVTNMRTELGGFAPVSFQAI